MADKRLRFVLSFILLLTMVSCGSAQTKSETKPSPVSKSALPDDKDFIGEGSGADFSEARNNAYSDVMRLAVLSILGDGGYQKNSAEIEKSYLGYINARKYILGEMEKTVPEKQKKWVMNTRDGNGKLLLKLQAFVNLKKLSEDLSASGITPAPSAASLTQNPAVTAAKNPDNQTDLSGGDISSLTFLVYYNVNDPAIRNDPDQVTYSKWAVDLLNSGLAAQNIQTFDVDAMDKLASERNLLQESSAGNVGVGSLLAQKVYAELYAEISPAVNYQGNKANVILNVKVFVRTTGALIASLEKGGQQYESASLAASIKMSMREAAAKINQDLTASLKKYVSNGRFYFVRLSGVNSYRDASRFTTTVSKIDGVINATLKSGSKEDRVYDYSIQYRGNPNELVDRLFETMPDKPGFEKFDLKEIRGNELIFTLE